MGLKRTNKLIPVNIGVANAIGGIPGNARVDHVHNHPAGLGTDLHHNEIHVLDPGTGPHTGLPTILQVRNAGPVVWALAPGDADDFDAVTGIINKQFADTKLLIIGTCHIYENKSVVAYDIFSLRITIGGVQEADSVLDLLVAYPHGMNVLEEGQYLTTHIVVDGLAAGNHTIALNLNIDCKPGWNSGGQLREGILTVVEVF